MSDNSVIVLIGYMGCGKSSVGKKLESFMKEAKDNYDLAVTQSLIHI